jgi:haloacetate dehalogenase
MGAEQQNEAMFEAFQVLTGTPLFARVGGHGPPLLLLHGHPQTQAMWHAVADELAQQFTVVMADLRGYGRSPRVAADPAHHGYSKRVMAQELLDLMQGLGHPRFAVLAHDRGARVAHRLALDHPDHVSRLMLLDIAPTLAMYQQTSEAFARAYWHWFFLIQPAPLPERLIEADPLAYLHDVMGRRAGGLGIFSPPAWADYQHGIQVPGTATSICEDYRASASIDLEHDRASRAAGQRLSMPLQVLWGEQGVVAQCFDVPALWRAAAQQTRGQALPCGHYVAEEVPHLLLAQALSFFKERT